MIKTYTFTQRFIETLADDVYQMYVDGQDLQRLCFVFGGKRPALFLKRALSRKIKAPFISPQIISIDDLIIQANGRRTTIQPLDHAYLVYDLARRYAPGILKGKETFVHFLPWAKEIIHFIEQLDLEDVPADAMQMLKEHAQIGFNVPADINDLLKALVLIRKHYHAHLEEHQLSTRGYGYLQASRLAAGQFLDQYDAVYFCNFFFLHKTEMNLIRTLVNQGKGHLILQGDQRKWPALKRIGSVFNQEILEGDQIAERNFKLNLYAAVDIHAQAGMVAHILEQIPDLSNTVIVLPQSDFILPLLSLLPDKVQQYNVSIGYPLTRSAVYTLLDFIVQAHKHIKEGKYYARDYLRILRHPLVKGISMGPDEGIVRVMVHKIEEALTGVMISKITGLIFLNLKDILDDDMIFSSAVQTLAAMDIQTDEKTLKEHMVQVHHGLIDGWKGCRNFTELSIAVDRYCNMLEDQSSMGGYPLNNKVCARLKEIALAWRQSACKDQNFDEYDLLKIMQESLVDQVIAFSGSPLKGLQILGLQETRSLSFDQVIIVDLNERSLPNLNIYEPLIPREVLVKMNIDRLELEEEIQRYHFMRLISCAKDVHLIYQDRPDKERSRYVEELVWEQEQSNGVINSVPIQKGTFHVAIQEHRRVVQKTPAMAAQLKAMTFSASSINLYLRNPYEFYLSYVLGLKEKDDLLDEVQAKHVGTFIHHLLEESFKPWLGKKPVIDQAFRQQFMAFFENRFTQFFGRGKNADAYLLKVVILHRLNHFLDEESKRLVQDVAEILFIERKFTDVLHTSQGPVAFQFRVDRVDRLNDGTILILDYKTGGSDVMPSLLKEGEELSREMIRDTIKSFQMPLYLYYLQKQYPGQPVNAALYHMRTMKLEPFINNRTALPTTDLVSAYMQSLDYILAEIFNPDFPFVDDPVDIE